MEITGGEEEEEGEDTQLRLENDHPGAMAGKDHTVAKKQERRTSGGRGRGGGGRGGKEQEEISMLKKRMRGKKEGEKEALSIYPFQPAGHGGSTHAHTARRETKRSCNAGPRRPWC